MKRNEGNSASQLLRSALFGLGQVRLTPPGAEMPTLGSPSTLAWHICEYLSSQSLEDHGFVAHIKQEAFGKKNH